MDMMLQLLTAFTGSVGFCCIFRLQRKFILPASLGGLLSWWVYLAFSRVFPDLFISTLFASAAAALYAEFLARICKAPATIFIIPAAVPLIPGRALYYTMNSAVRSDWDALSDFGYQAVMVALGISAGISLTVVFFSILSEWLKSRTSHP